MAEERLSLLQESSYCQCNSLKRFCLPQGTDADADAARPEGRAEPAPRSGAEAKASRWRAKREHEKPRGVSPRDPGGAGTRS